MRHRLDRIASLILIGSAPIVQGCGSSSDNAAVSPPSGAEGSAAGASGGAPAAMQPAAGAGEGPGATPVGLDNGGSSDPGGGAPALPQPGVPSSEFPAARAEGLAATPPMGWNSWNYFQGNVTAEIIRQVADAMVSSGMRDAGYQYINIDDGWAAPSDTTAGNRINGEPVLDADFGEGGIPALAEYVHALGLKLGIYSDRGYQTCAKRVGSRGYEEQDARTFAAWGVDYLKYDNCDYLSLALDNYDGHDLTESVMREEHGRMAAAVASSGRPMVFSLCAWSFYEWGLPFSQLWRTTSDITDDWPKISSIIGDNGTRLAAYAGPNQWNDPDMLQVGNGGMTSAEYQTHFGMWAMMAAPLIAGNDLRAMSQETLAILTNREVIAIDQDALGFQGVRVAGDGQTSVWAKPLGRAGARAVALLNQTDVAQDITFSLSQASLQNQPATLRDLWAGRDLGSTDASGQFTGNVAPHAVLLLEVVGTEPELPAAGDVALSSLMPIYAANAIGPAESNRSNGGAAAGDGGPLSIRGVSFDSGLGVAAGSLIAYRVGARCTRFRAVAGVDDQASDQGTVAFEVWGDHQRLFQSEILGRNSPGLPIEVDITGVLRLRLKVTNGLDGGQANTNTTQDFASWGDARVECAD